MADTPDRKDVIVGIKKTVAYSPWVPPGQGRDKIHELFQATPSTAFDFLEGEAPVREDISPTPHAQLLRALTR